MKNKLLKLLSLGLVITVLVGCGSTEVEDAGGDNAVSTGTVVDDSSAEIEDNFEDIEESSIENIEIEEEPTYTEGTEVVLLDNVDHNQVKKEDWIDAESLSLIEGENRIVITKEVDIYHIDGLYAGYAKIGARPVWIAGDDEWNSITFADGVYFVKKDELPDAMMLASEYDKQMQVADNNNTESEDSGGTNQNPETNEPDINYTVTDMSKTMYAKQSVNVRSGPSSDYERLGGLSINQEVTVTGQADTGWYRILFDGGEAFVSNSYLSDNRVEVATNPETGSGGNTTPSGGSGDSVSSGEDNVSGAGGEVPSQPAESVPETPSTTYSEAEVIAIVRSTLEGAGAQWYPDSDGYARYPEFGLDGGMGWGIGDYSMTDPQTDADNLLAGFLWCGHHYYYIESLGSSNGYVTLKIYGG